MTSPTSPKWSWRKLLNPTNGYTLYDWQLEASAKGPTRLYRKRVNANDGQGEAFWWYTELTGDGREVKAPDGSYEWHYFDGFGQESETRFLSATNTFLKKVVKTWQTGGVVNPRILTETTILEPDGANLHSKIEYIYDTNGYLGGTNGNITEMREYGFATGAPGVLMRRTNRSYLVNSTYGIDGLHISGRRIRAA